MTALGNLESLRFVAPEIALAAGVVLLLVVDLVARRPSRRRAGAIALLTVGAALVCTFATFASSSADARGLFGGLIAHDPFTDFFKLIFLAGTALTCATALRARDTIETDGPERDRDAAELYALLLTVCLGMDLMAAATDLLLAFLSLELVSLASYLLAGWKRRDRRSAEAALKFVIYGGVAAGVMLYGMSLLYGLAGATAFVKVRAACASAPALPVVLAVALCLAGFAYKVAAVPFHMWCPDVYEGAPTPITALFAVGPKAAGFALLLRFLDQAVVSPHALARSPWPLLVGVMGAATMTYGNFAALHQTNVKRLLAYSSIAQAGYLLAAFVAGDAGRGAILVYLVIYLFMGFGAFVTVGAVEEAGVPADLASWRGLAGRARMPAASMAIFMFSLTGIPPLAGFVAKFQVFAALVGEGSALGVILAAIAVGNSALSLYIYARVVKAMYFEPADDPSPVAVAPLHRASIGLCAAANCLLIFAWSPLANFAAHSLHAWPNAGGLP